MITDFIITMVSWLIDFLSFLMPSEWSLPVDMMLSIKYFLNGFSGWNSVFPVYTMFTILISLFLFEVSFVTYKISYWLIKLIRG